MKHATTPKGVAERTDKALKQSTSLLSVLPKNPEKMPCTVANTLEPLNQIMAILNETQGTVAVLGAAHPDPKIRTAAEKADQKLTAFSSNLYTNQRIYLAIKNVPEKNLDRQTKRFREKELFAFRRMGIDKPKAVQQEIKRLINQKVRLGQIFSRNIKDDVQYLTLPSEALDGLPEDYRKSHPVDRKGNVRISTQYPDYFPFMQYAKESDARRQLITLYLNRAWPKNDAIFRKLLVARKRHAELLGYRDWADFITADKMTGSAKTVKNFLDRGLKITEKKAHDDYKILVERKRKDDPRAKSLTGWEMSYYENILSKEKIGLDTQEVRQYFPFRRVQDGVLQTMAELFGLKFKKVYEHAWHKDVEVFDVDKIGRNGRTGGDGRAGKNIGRFYLDLHPREGKYGHAACYDIRQGIRGQQLPEAALLCNFSRDLMSHGEVTTFFHEFGHLMHFILAGDQRWVRFSGTATEWDFIEAPSQMLEEWALDYPTLKKFARHEKTGKPIPKALVEKLREAERFGKGIWIQRQMFLGILSLRYHQDPSPAHMDLLAIMKKEQKKIETYPYVPDTHFYANFGHLNGYSAMYYTYMWSLAIARDILTPFQKHGMQNKKISKQYVEKILAPGGSEDAGDLIRNFLGRDWNLDAFRKWVD